MACLDSSIAFSKVSPYEKQPGKEGTVTP